MQITLTANRDDLKDAATQAFADGKDIAKSTLEDAQGRAQGLIEEATEKAQDVAADVAAKGRKRYGRRVERKLEKAAKKLPVDTPIDKRRRQRTRRRGGRGTFLLIVVGGVVAGYLIWRARQPQEDQFATAPDAFGAAVEDADNGQRTPARHSSTT